MADPKVPRHWIVAPWTNPDPVNWPLGQAGSVYSVLYDNLADAQAQARAQAALAPGSVWVVYVATWYAYTDTTPVNLLPVVGQAI
ncbi:MAG: hypothetical protein C5B60_07100 [Chloroflexi bacterium]|nr:MAG: hypothetical protein C5B60_07100 [Chloroflexota bacterium]